MARSRPFDWEAFASWVVFCAWCGSANHLRRQWPDYLCREYDCRNPLAGDETAPHQERAAYNREAIEAAKKQLGEPTPEDLAAYMKDRDGYAVS